jgi:SAM-dependent methyltransferase
MNYPNFEDYRKLYARYDSSLSELSSELMDQAESHAGPFEGLSVVDICGGTGDFAIECIWEGAKEVLVVEQEPEMVDRQYMTENGIMVVNMSAEHWVSVPKPAMYDVVFCRQAVNYWFSDSTVQDLARCMTTGGVFLFDAPRKCPSVMPLAKTYGLNGREYVEVSWRVEDMIYNVQCCEGVKPHSTQFRWIEPKDFLDVLNRHFHIVEVTSLGGTDVYTCVKA